MTYLLDTNVISELRRIDRAHPGVARWAADVPAHDFLLSVLTLLELERGIVQAERRGRPEAPILRSWYERDVVETFRGRTFPVTDIIARRASQLEGEELADQLIAATALVHDLVVVTRNTRHFAPFGVRLLNPFT